MTIGRRGFLLRCAGLLGAALPLHRLPILSLATAQPPGQEEVLLGMMVLNRRWIEIISPIRFSLRIRRPANRVVFDAIFSLDGAKKLVDLVTLSDFLQQRGLLRSVGGPEYLASLVMAVPNPETLEANLNRGRRLIS